MLKPTHKAIKRYLEEREKLETLGITNEMGLRAPFQQLLAETAREVKWHFVPEQRVHGTTIRPDGVFLTEWKYPLGHWESKDTRDDLEIEINKKRDKGYPFRNIIFEDSKRAVLFQNRVRMLDATLTNPDEVARLLWQFYQHKEENYEDFERAVTQFKADVPELAKSVAATVHAAYEKDKNYRAAFESFFELCQSSLNPDIRREAVEEMLVQHLLTERLIRTVFDNPEFTKRNVIAAEVEKVIVALVAKTFDRNKFLAHLDRFYIAIEGAARDLHEFRDKQNFLNTVYERFFQGYSVKIADTHGIVYTPQPIVDFMCASVAEVLEQEFGKKLGDKGVNILDPCTGTGNFIVNLMRRIPPRDLPRMYREQLFANEVMLMPYYIAALNIEHAYFDLSGEYEPFEGMCFVDTLDMAEGAQHQLGFMTAKNTERVERQKKTPITVIIGNPPYNTKQLNENDNSKNRKYPIIDRRISQTYARGSQSTNLIALYDPYVKFIRWASDRIGKEGVIAFVSNSSYVNSIAFDSMRKHLSQDFDVIYIVDLKGDVRKDSMRDGIPIGEEHTVFGLAAMVGISIGFFIRTRNKTERTIRYADVHFRSTRSEKFDFLAKTQSIRGIEWRALTPDGKHNWLIPQNSIEFGRLIPIGSKEAKKTKSSGERVLFNLYSRGVATCRDSVVYGDDEKHLVKRVRTFIHAYNSEVLRYTESDSPPEIDEFVDYGTIDWSLGLKNKLKRGLHAKFKPPHIIRAQYRPFYRRWLYYDELLNEALYRWREIMPTGDFENHTIIAGGYGRKAFSLLISKNVSDVNFFGDPGQCFPFYVYNEDGTGRRENITDWALSEFQKRYSPVCHPEDIPMAEGSLLSSGKKCKRGKKTEILPEDGQDDKSKDSGYDQDSAFKSQVSGLRSSASSFIPHPSSLTKWDIFYYVYGLLHHPGYRGKYADNLKRELPRIPFAPDFWAFSDAGKKLAELHLKYEEIDVEMPQDQSQRDPSARRRASRMTSKGMRWLVNADVPLSYHVEKMKLTKPKDEGGRMKDETASLRVNESLTLANIPPEVFEYRLGNRSALEWVIDQYQISTDKRSGIKSDPNREDDEQYIVRLIGQVIHVSLETVKIVNSLPAEFE